VFSPLGGDQHHSWQDLLAVWVQQKLTAGEEDILSEAGPEFERIV